MPVFERPHHQRIAQVLQTLDGALLQQRACLFGGGTAMSLRFGEYRESVDIDFRVSDLAQYRWLRQGLTGPQGLRALAHAGSAAVWQQGELRADQYGIRTRLRVPGGLIKFEIVLEARITLEQPGRADHICGVPTLTRLDMAASKLLANSDRWADDGVFNRDLIDLAMMRAPLPLLQAAATKAQSAYGASVLRDLARAIERLRGREGWLVRCMKAMGMTIPPALVWQRVRAVQRLLPPG